MSAIGSRLAVGGMRCAIPPYEAAGDWITMR
jgi:hypothetical protein